MVAAGGQFIGQGVTARSIEDYIDGFGITLSKTSVGSVNNVLVSLQVKELNTALRQEFNIPSNISGLVVSQVGLGSAAERSGVQPGDIITEINRTKIGDLGQYHSVISTAKKDEAIVLLLNRRGNELLIAVQP
jgi:S1-C subfamily serine protease